jgi:hypothetical protein
MFPYILLREDARVVWHTVVEDPRCIEAWTVVFFADGSCEANRYFDFGIGMATIRHLVDGTVFGLRDRDLSGRKHPMPTTQLAFWIEGNLRLAEVMGLFSGDE